MTDVDRALEAAAAAFFLLGDVETITYEPAGGGSREISAVVDRRQAEPMDGLSGGTRPQVELVVRNDATAGIASSSVDTGGDKVQVALRRGDTAQTLRIVDLVNQDAAMIRIRAY
jgi:hypothetical protein